MFKIACIGCGNMATRGHGPSYKLYAQKNPKVELTACCDIIEEKAKKFAEAFGFKTYYTDIDTMLDTEKPDAVCLIAPVTLTMPLSIKVMKKGYPLITEKPPGMNVKETKKMIECAQKNNVPNQVAFNRRYIPVVKKAKEMLSAYKKEEIDNIEYNFYRVGREDPDFSTTTIHAIDAVKFLAGSDYKSVKFTYQQTPSTPIGNIFLDCVFESGTTANIRFLPASGLLMERALISLKDNAYFLNIPSWKSYDSPGKIMHFKKDELIEEISGYDIGAGETLYQAGGFYQENQSFFNDIRKGVKPEGDIKSGLQSVEIAEYIRRRENEYTR